MYFKTSYTFWGIWTVVLFCVSWPIAGEGATEDLVFVAEGEVSKICFPTNSPKINPIMIPKIN
jgi:hypothetical protein